MITPHEEGEEADEWIMSLADLMSLLMAFFLLLYSMSTMDEGKFKEYGIAISKSFEIKDRQRQEDTPIEAEGKEQVRKIRALQMLIAILNLGDENAAVTEIENIYDKKLLKENMGKQVKQEMKEIADMDAKIVENSDKKPQVIFELAFPMEKLFPNNASTIGSAGTEALRKISNILKQSIGKTDIEIICHTSSRPPAKGSGFATNWELSASRAMAIARVFTDLGIPGKFMTVKGMGNLEPILPEFDAQGEPIAINMQRNFRAHIVVKRITNPQGS